MSYEIISSSIFLYMKVVASFRLKSQASFSDFSELKQPKVNGLDRIK